MKYFAFLILGFIITQATAQGHSSSCLPKIDYLERNGTENTPAIFINGKHFNQTVSEIINPQKIDSISVLKEEIIIEDMRFYGQVYISLHPFYEPQFISLSELREKCDIQKNIGAIFMLNDAFISSDYNTFQVDEKYILKIEVERIKNKQENVDVNIIRLITKSEANLEKEKEIFIRGT